MHIQASQDGSSVDASITSPGCWDCFVQAEISGNLDDVQAMLGTEEHNNSMTFDFFDLTVGGLIGTADIAVNATLALASPDESIVGEGFGGFASFLYIFNHLEMTWIQPEEIALADGTFLSVTFEDLFEFGLGNTTTVSATMTRYAAVPEPGTAALLVLGMLALWFASRSRRIDGNRAHSAAAA
jgi:hypothetical protein